MQKSEIQQKSVHRRRLGITCFRRTPSGIIHNICLSLSSFSTGSWQHFHFSSLSVGMQTSLNTTEGLQFVPKTQRISAYYNCLPSRSMQKAWQFESIVSSRLQKSRAMFSKLDARISRRLFYMQKAQHELSYFQKSALLSALQHCVSIVRSALRSLCAAMCKLTKKQRIHSRLQVIIHMCIYFHPPRKYLCHTFHMGVVRWWTCSRSVSALLCTVGQVRHPIIWTFTQSAPTPIDSSSFRTYACSSPAHCCCSTSLKEAGKGGFLSSSS